MVRSHRRVGTTKGKDDGRGAQQQEQPARSVQTLRPYRSIAVQPGIHILRAGTPLHDQVQAIITAVNAAGPH